MSIPEYQLHRILSLQRCARWTARLRTTNRILTWAIVGLAVLCALQWWWALVRLA